MLKHERLKFSLIIGDYWRVPEGSKSSGEKIITGELLNFYQNINSTGGFSFPLEKIAFQNGQDLSSYKEQNSTGGFFNSLEKCSLCTKKV